MMEKASSKMRLVNDGKMRHPTDSKAWKHVDSNYNWFASDAHDLRLGSVSDGFYPFEMQNVADTTWLVILIPKQFASLVVLESTLLDDVDVDTCPKIS